MKPDIEDFRRMTINVVVVTAAILLIMIIILLLFSPGKTVPYLDDRGKPMAGSISEKTFLSIGGITQGMFIKSKNRKNPVLLYLHGGIPDYFLAEKYPTGLEEYFTVVWWDQRGAGLSYHSDIPSETLNLDQMISDTKEVTNYLRSRFGQEKIYLMGRSGGSYIGIQAAANSPELYHAYIGVAQMSNQLESERLAYKFLLKNYRQTGNRKMLRKLEAFPVTDVIPPEYLKLRDRTMHSLGVGTTHHMKSVVSGLFIPSLAHREFTLKEKYGLWRGKSESGVHPLWNSIIKTDLAQQTDKLNIPVYFFHGIYDYTVSYPLAKDYFEVLEAPKKGFYTFKNSAHSPHFEEPRRVKEIFINDILKGGVSLADH